VSSEKVSESCLKTALCRCSMTKAVLKRLRKRVPMRYRILDYDVAAINREIRTKTDNFMKVPTIPVIVKCVVTSSRPHFTDTRSKRVGMRPTCLYIFTACPSCSNQVIEAEVIAAALTMPVDMPAGDGDIHTSVGIDLHSLRVFRIAFPHVF
jgi:hypothetical protein